MIKKAPWLLCILPTLALAVDRVQTAPIEGVQGAGVYAVDLTPSQAATLQQVPEMQLQVLDAKGQPMPRRLLAVMQDQAERWVPMTVYPWPSEDPLSAEDALSLQVQIDDQRTTASLTLPQPAPVSEQMQQRQWLLVTPEELHDLPETSLRFDIDWPNVAQSTAVQIEGSDNLLSWQSAGSGTLLQAKQNTGLTLKQNRLYPMGHYRYWRLTLSQPLPIASARLVIQDAPKPVTTRYQVQFLPTNMVGQWQADVGAAWTVSGMHWEVPADQVWAFHVQVQRPTLAGHQPQWQSVGEARLHHWTHPPLNQAARQQDLWFESPVAGQIWRLNGQATAQALSVGLDVPNQQLLFLAQGQAPYRVQVGQALSDATWSMQLPNQTPKAQGAHLGTWQMQQPPVPWRQYGLWAVLVLAVLVLAGVAWRLMRQLKTDQNFEKK